jgi:hypothetical protein
MTSPFDDALETKKFQMYAAKADTAEKRIELCKKYLAAKKVKEQTELPWEDQPKVPWDGPQYWDSKGIHRLETRFSLPEYGMKGIPNVEIQDMIYKELMKGISHEILKRKLYNYDIEKRMYEQDTIYKATVFVWKDPNKP